MANPTNREEFAEHILTRCGHPVVKVNVSQGQIDIVIDQAINKFQEYYTHGTTDEYFAHQISQDDIDNGWIPIEEGVNAIEELIPFGNTWNTTDFTSMAWQYSASVIMDVSVNRYYLDLVDFTMIQQQLYNTASVLGAFNQPFRYNKFSHQLILDFKHNVGDCVIVHQHKRLDFEDEANKSVWGELWFQEYAAALLKMQWGNNLMKFGGNLSGEVTVNGESIFNEGKEAVEKLEEDLIESHQFPAFFVMA